MLARDFTTKVTDQLIIPKDRLADVYGFITSFKDNIYVFKTADPGRMAKGSRCDQAATATVNKTLNKIVGEIKYITGKNKIGPIRIANATQLCSETSYT